MFVELAIALTMLVITFGSMTFVWCIYCGASRKHKIYCIVISLLLIIALCFCSIIYSDKKYHQDDWNGGYCDCDTHWVLGGVIRTEHGRIVKYYYCPNCYSEIKVKT